MVLTEIIQSMKIIKVEKDLIGIVANQIPYTSQ
jgi:hypothetical protein